MDTKISAMPVATEFADADLLTIVQGSVNKQLTKALALTGGTGEDIVLKASTGHSALLASPSGNAIVEATTGDDISLLAQGFISFENINVPNSIEIDGTGVITLEVAGANTTSLVLDLSWDATLTCGGPGSLALQTSGTGNITMEAFGTGNIEISNGSTGTITIQGVGTGAMLIEQTGNGTLTIQTAGSGTLTLEATGSGNVSVKATGGGGAAIQASGAGAVSIGSAAGAININTTNGGAISLDARKGGDVSLVATIAQTTRLTLNGTSGDLVLATTAHGNSITLSGGSGAISIVAGTSLSMSYFAGNPSDWDTLAPIDIAVAIDRCAALLKVLNAGTGP